VLRRTSVASVVLALTAAVTGTAAAADIDTVYPSKGDSAVDVTRYGLDLTWKPTTRQLEGIATIRLRGVETGPSFQLDLATSMRVSSVTVGGIAVGFTHDTKDLVVAAPVVAGTPYDVVVTYAGKPHTVTEPTSRGDATGLGWHTTDDGRVWTMQKPYGAYTWYPVNDHPSDKASYTFQLDVPEEWVGVANGRLDSKSKSDGRTVTKFVGDHPMASYLVTVAIGPYKKYTQDGPHGIPLTYWVPKGKSELLKPLEKTPDALAWLEKKLGPYPFSRAGVVVTPGEGSVETQTLTTLATGNYRYGNADVKEQVAHDLAHAWYGDTVTPNDWRDLWMNEGMATYLEAKYAVSQGWDTWKYWKREFARNDQYWRDLYGPPGAYLPDEFGQRSVHYGSALLLERLRTKIGGTAFKTAMAAWPQQNAYTSRARPRYIEFLEQQSGQPLAAWFQDWLMSGTTPAA
jgi:aminopeptidase N